MKFLIITHLIHNKHGDKIYGYGPYIREMNIWLRYVDELTIVAPISSQEIDSIEIPYDFPGIKFIKVPSLNFTSWKNRFRSLLILPLILVKILRGMMWAEHIHLRCPGNMGLLGLCCQIFFSTKSKTIKYAGNWDDYSGEHLSYKLQKIIIRNTLFTRNAKAIIYGSWKNFTKNCIPFFTASYSIKETSEIPSMRTMNDRDLRFLFVGALNERKRPDLSILVINKLVEKGVTNIRLDILGNGPYFDTCTKLIQDFNLHKHVFLHGNVPLNDISQFYNRAHFMVFLSRMEGWPKVIAEAMFWGCVPVTTAISCVPWMLDHGKRGVLVNQDAEEASERIFELIQNPFQYEAVQGNAINWSRRYTLEYFEESIGKLMVSSDV